LKRLDLFVFFGKGRLRKTRNMDAAGVPQLMPETHVLGWYVKLSKNPTVGIYWVTNYQKGSTAPRIATRSLRAWIGSQGRNI
jgi:hypothetical protein